MGTLPIVAFLTRKCNCRRLQTYLSFHVVMVALLSCRQCWTCQGVLVRRPFETHDEIRCWWKHICLVTSCLAILIVLLATNVQKCQIVIDLRRWMQRSIQRTEIHSKPSFYIVLHCRGCMWSPILLFKKRQGSRARCLFDFLNRHCMSCTGRSCCLNSQGFVFHLLGCRCPSIKGALE